MLVHAQQWEFLTSGLLLSSGNLKAVLSTPLKSALAVMFWAYYNSTKWNTKNNCLILVFPSCGRWEANIQIDTLKSLESFPDTHLDPPCSSTTSFVNTSSLFILLWWISIRNWDNFCSGMSALYRGCFYYLFYFYFFWLEVFLPTSLRKEIKRKTSMKKLKLLYMNILNQIQSPKCGHPALLQVL